MQSIDTPLRRPISHIRPIRRIRIPNVELMTLRPIRCVRNDCVVFDGGSSRGAMMASWEETGGIRLLPVAPHCLIMTKR